MRRKEVKVVSSIYGLREGDRLYYNPISGLYEFNLTEKNVTEEGVSTSNSSFKLHPDTVDLNSPDKFEYVYDSEELEVKEETAEERAVKLLELLKNKLEFVMRTPVLLWSDRAVVRSLKNQIYNLEYILGYRKEFYDYDEV